MMGACSTSLRRLSRPSPSGPPSRATPSRCSRSLVHRPSSSPALSERRSRESKGSRFYLTLDQALGGGWAEITEISEQGSVPELRVTNKGAKAVFILDGEELVGSKQNRVVNLSILVPATSKLTIPVSSYVGPTFRPGEAMTVGRPPGAVGMGLDLPPDRAGHQRRGAGG